MNVYFEVADSVVDKVGGKYFAVYNVKKEAVIIDTHRTLGQYSNRIWQEDESGVKYIKNRFVDIYDTKGYDVDMKEFFWIKLKCQPA
jgi:hypothetical protein